MFSTDTISSGDEPEPTPPRTRRPAAPTPGARTTALTAALALVLAGGVATAAYRTSTDAADPATLIPASAFAVATIDLSAAEDGLGGFADRFPGSPTRDGDGSAVDRLLRPVFDEPADPALSYDKTVRPWLGDQVAIAGWLDDGSPRLLAVLESRDDDAARKLLPPALDDGAFVISSHYVVISDTEAIVKRSLAAAADASLADNPTYAADVGALPEGEAAVGWLDGPAAKKALVSAMGGMGSPEDLFGGMPFTLGGDPFEQRVALGLHVTDDYVQADMRTYGSSTPAATAPSGLVTELPSGTIGAAAFTGVDKLLDTMFGFISNFTGFGMGVTECSASGGSVGAYPTPPLAEIPRGTPNRRELMKAQRRALRQYMQQAEEQAPPTPLSFDCGASEPADPIEEFEKMSGLSLPADAKSLLGDRLVVSFGGINLNGPPSVALRTHPGDVDEARRVAGKLSAVLAQAADFGFFVETADDDLVLGTTSAYAKLVAESGSLGADEAFTSAMGDVPDEISSAVFVDLTRVWPLLEAQGGDIGGAKQLTGFGMWTGIEGDVQVAQLRLVAG